MFAHVEQIKLREAAEKIWAVRISSHPHFDVSGQKSNFKLIEKLGEVSNRKRRKTAFELADSDETRLRMIGGELRSQGDKWDEWVIRHPKEMRWLKVSGKSLEDAKDAFDQWWDDAMGDDYDCSGDGFIAVGIGQPRNQI